MLSFRAPEIDMSELESLFSAAVSTDIGSTEKGGSRRASNAPKQEIVHLVCSESLCFCLMFLGSIPIEIYKSEK